VEKDEVTAYLVKLEASLDAHKTALDKHEDYDDKRFQDLKNGIKIIWEDSKEDHKLTRSLVEGVQGKVENLQGKIAWFGGVLAASLLVAEWFISK
jgi:hypothetical protein